ncbi:hypothetical protein [Vibrio zhanjiangensis]|nr:hypothetical protein [Vibrio zhanjiangensis]
MNKIQLLPFFLGNVIISDTYERFGVGGVLLQNDSVTLLFAR